MASPITTLGAATIAPAASVTSPNAEMASTAQAQPAQPAPPTAPAAAAQPPPPPKDRVDLSPAALDMSKELTTKKEEEKKQPALYDDQLKRKLNEPVIEKPTDKPSLSSIKQYPPYMGNSEELKMLRSLAPALYRQVLQMIVPPPVNISYSDAQLLKRPDILAKG